MRYEHARALFGLADHLLTHRHHRSRATDALVDARLITTDLGATSLTRDIDILASQTHLQVRLPDTGRPTARIRPPTPRNSGTHPREREVLDALLSGATYAQIADRLFISDKTVSTHVSNLLKKTGTTSRIELAALASRNAGTAEQDRHPPGHRS